MNALKLIVGVPVLLGIAILEPTTGLAQQPQIPTLQVCNPTTVEGKAEVFIKKRQDGTTGTFTVVIELSCNPDRNGYPSGNLEMKVDMSDSTITGLLVADTFEQVTTTGKHTPTTYLNGRCKAEKVRGGCRYWMMLADNKEANAKGTPDVIGFLVFDAKGKRVAYGTGPVTKGDIKIAGTAF